MKFQIGDVVHLIDGVDYDSGNSMSFVEGYDVEIIGYKEDKYLIRDFYRPVEESEIERLVVSNSEKCVQYENELSLYNAIVYIKTGSLTFKEVTIRYYSFQFKDFMYVFEDRDKTHCRTGEFWHTLLDAYKTNYEKLVHKMRDIQKLTNV